MKIHKNCYNSRKPVHGVGVNASDYVTKNCQYYTTWKEMLRRCYSAEYHARKPTYIGCSVCEEWKTFSNFKTWMETQVTHQRSNKDLPVGVSYDSSRNLYRATCQDKDNKHTFLGRFKTVKEAHDTYRRYKASILQEYLLEITEIKLLEGLKQHIRKLLMIWETPTYKIIPKTI